MANSRLEVDSSPYQKPDYIETRKKSSGVIKSHIASLVDLEPRDPDVDFLINSLRFASYSYSLTREESSKLIKAHAFRHVVVVHMVSLSRAFGWDRDSAEIKYMTGVLFQTNVENRIEWLQGKVENAQVRKFETTKQAEQQLGIENAELAKLNELYLILIFNLNKFKTENFSEREEKEDYIKVLEQLATMANNYNMSAQRRDHIKVSVARHIRAGEIKEALKYFRIYAEQSEQTL